MKRPGIVSGPFAVVLVDGLLTFSVNGEKLSLPKPFQLSFRQLAAQSVFLDVAGHVFPPQPQLLVVEMVQLLENLDGLRVC